jgi:hypothetical protein
MSVKSMFPAVYELHRSPMRTVIIHGKEVPRRGELRDPSDESLASHPRVAQLNQMLKPINPINLLP